ncbi:hypothetical protein IWQ62_006209 [Dispira parvispora]|uniref:Ribosome recycling factor domain-containing protein n=1 Tax=Dispira parvispora TaxID=1520584 RepID=A0A9W8AI87_9FUNG|nr:hypothetical protein IWQ62_006209 [Dispira parvispora]
MTAFTRQGYRRLWSAVRVATGSRRLSPITTAFYIPSKISPVQSRVTNQVLFPVGASLTSRQFSSKKSGKRGKQDKEVRMDDSDNAGRSKKHNEGVDMQELTLDLEQVTTRMQRAVDHLKAEFKSMRIGQATPIILDPVRVSVEGDVVALSDLATVTIKDPQTLLVIPSDEEYKPYIEKAIREAQLGLNPISQDAVIKVPIPKPTQEHRNKLLKVATKLTEQAKVGIRGVRQNAVKDLKQDAKRLGLSKEEQRYYEKQIQDLTDSRSQELDRLLQNKSRDINRH